MPAKLIGDKPLPGAQRQARLHARRNAEHTRWRKALEEIAALKGAPRHRNIAVKALEHEPVTNNTLDND